MTLSVDVHEMQLGSGAVIVHRMVCWGVNVPAGQVDRLVIVGQRGVVSIDALGVLHGKSRTVSPIPEASHRLVGIVESGDVIQREAVVEAERDWGLLGSSLAKFVV